MSKIYLVFPKKRGRIAPELYGHFSEHIGGVIYDGIWVGKESAIPNEKGFRKFIIDKMKRIAPPVLRWPGGCYAEVYDWRDGIGGERPTRVNWWTKADGRYESNEVGTHEFINFCNLIGAKPYFAVNVTTASALDGYRWMDYCMSPAGSTALALEREKNGSREPFTIPYWGVGNENWGGGGNMRPEYYTDLFRRYAAILNNFPVDFSLIAGGANEDDYNWTHKYCETVGGAENFLRMEKVKGYSFHYYTHITDHVLEYTRDDWYHTFRQGARIQEMIDRHWSIISGHGLEKEGRLVIDEWGIWHHANNCDPAEGGHLFEQQSTMREAVHAAMTLNIFNNSCEKIMMANIAQLVNNIHSLFLSLGENCIVTPTYHVFDMYKAHQGANLIETVCECGEEEGMKTLSVSASQKDGKVTVTIANLSYDTDEEVELVSLGAEAAEALTVTLLHGEDCRSHNTFEAPDAVTPERYTVKGNKITIPKASVVTVSAECRIENGK